MNKKAQVSFFLIIGVVMVILLILLFILGNSGLKSKFPSKKLSVNDVSTFLESSLTKSSEHCIVKIGMQGQRYFPENYLRKTFADIEYAYDKEDKYLSEEEFKKELESCINDTMLSCVSDFSEIKKKGFEVKYSFIKPIVELGKSHVSVSASSDLIFEKGSEKWSFEDFKTKRFSLPLLTMHNMTKELTEKRKEFLNDSDIPLDYLASKDMQIEIYEEEENKDLYSMNDLDSKIEDKDYYFIFSNNFE